MYRVVFCPDDNGMPEAEELAKKHQLPVLVGRNERLEGVSFDDSSVSVIEVPTDSWMRYDDKVMRPGAIHSVEYADDYRELSPSVRMIVDSPSGSSTAVPPSVSERHLARFVHRPRETGKHLIRIEDGDDTLSTGHFEVGEE